MPIVKVVQIGCPQCNTGMKIQIPDDWTMNVIGALQFQHNGCGQVFDLPDGFRLKDLHEVAKDVQEEELTKILTNEVTVDKK